MFPYGSLGGTRDINELCQYGVIDYVVTDSAWISSFTLGLIVNASDIAYLIPPSIGFIVYGVATSTSIGKFFLAGILPGFLVFFLFSVYSFLYSKVKGIGQYPKADLKERMRAIREGLPVMGFPLLIIGGSTPASSAPPRPRPWPTCSGSSPPRPGCATWRSPC